MNLLNIRMDSAVGVGVDESYGTSARANHVIARALVIAGGTMFGLVFGVIAALMFGMIDVC